MKFVDNSTEVEPIGYRNSDCAGWMVGIASAHLGHRFSSTCITWLPRSSGYSLQYQAPIGTKFVV